jgi:chemotaxis protein MotB
MYDKKQSNEENFWISYADLMAGLLFVFILVIGAIIIKYLYTQSDLKAIKTNLQEQKDALNLSEEELLNKKKKLTSVNSQLKKIQEEKVRLSFDLAKSQNMFNETKELLEKEKDLAKKLGIQLDEKNKNLELSIEQIEKITAILEDKENSIKLLNKNLEDERTTILEKTKEINLNLEEMAKLKALLFDYELQVKEQNVTNSELSTKLENQENMISLKDEELIMLENKILIQSKLHQKLVEEFDITKVKIKHLTGIKITVISKLREKLGKSINIDEKSGAITFSSNILFDQGEYTLKEESKKELSLALKKYLQALLDDESIRKYIHSITIEGHTDSDGSYLENLALSQQRALEVMQFLYTSQIADKTLLEKYVNASGRSYSDIIYKNGIEDKQSSRRIEIKFRIKNEAAIKELQNFLGEKK